MYMENGNTQMSAPPTAGDPAPISAPENREAPLAPLQLTPQRMQSIGVRLGTVAMKKVDGEIRVTGNVDVNERQLANVQLRFPGWIHKVFVNATYDLVHKGQPMLTIYSPELVTTEQEYLLARKNQQQMKTSFDRVEWRPEG